MFGGGFKNIFVYLIILMAAVFLMFNFSSQSKRAEEMPISQVAAEAREGNIKRITVSGDYSALKVEFRDGREPVLSRKGEDADVVEVLRNLGVSEEEIAAITIEYQRPSAWANWVTLLGGILPAIFLVGLFYFLLRQAQGTNSQALSFGKSRARMFTGDQPTVTFDDVAGVEEAKEELREVVEFLKEPEKFISLGARIPKGVLLVGAPGTGKTLMAKAVSGEAGVPFFSISGSEFVEMFVGVGASRVRDLFDQAKRHSPCLTGDTMVTLADGRQVTIQEMFERQMIGVKVPAMTDDFRLEEATVIGVTRRRPDDLYKITTVHSEIKATGNHLFPVLQQGRLVWVRADELRVGDFIATPRQIRTPRRTLTIFDFLPAETRVYLRGNHGTPKYVYLKDFASLEERAADIAKLVIGRGGFTDSTLMRFPLYVPPELTYVCGLIASDGAFGDNGHRSIRFFNTELALHQTISSTLRQLFEYQPRVYKNKKYYDTVLPQGKKPQCLQDSYTTWINGKLLVTLLREINHHILEFPEEHIAAWLRGVFDGDGSVKTSERCSNLTISAWDRAANAKIRQALHRVGIVVSKSKRSRKGQDGNIVITGRDNIRTFVTKIGSGHPDKARRLDSLKLEGSSASRIDAIPVGQLLKDARLSIGMGQRDFVINGRYRGHYVSQYERGLVTPSRASLQTVVEAMKIWCSERGQEPSPEVRALEALCYGDVLWARVVSIEPLPPKDYVYDLVLDRIHNFVAEGVILHNCIVFVDEIDAVGRHRGAGLGGSHDEREQTLNQILVEMDGFETDTRVIVLAATNRPDILDPALLRPGRFDRRVVLDIPDINGRKAILEVHVRGKPLASDVDLEVLARQTPGFVGADIENMVNEAAILAARRNKKVIGMEEFEEAIERVIAGPERKSRIISDEEKKIIAYHEAGHAIVMNKLPHCDPVHKVSIVSRGLALGYTMPLPEEDRYLKHRAKFKDELAGLLGGRAAEELMFNDVTTGAASDLEQATKLARKMVCEYGMSENLGPMTFGQKQELVFLGREIAEQRDYSEAVAQEIDREVRRFIDEAYSRAKELLTTYRDKLIALAQRLIEEETIEGSELEAMLA